MLEMAATRGTAMGAATRFGRRAATLRAALRPTAFLRSGTAAMTTVVIGL
jgi:hypothetical protein